MTKSLAVGSEAWWQEQHDHGSGTEAMDRYECPECRAVVRAMIGRIVKKAAKILAARDAYKAVIEATPVEVIKTASGKIRFMRLETWTEMLADARRLDEEVDG